MCLLILEILAGGVFALPVLFFWELCCGRQRCRSWVNVRALPNGNTKSHLIGGGFFNMAISTKDISLSL